MAEYIKADPSQPIKTVTPANGETFTLQEMQKLVEGYVQAIALTPKLILYVNEDGIMLKKPLNARATAKLWQFQPGWTGTPLLGDVFIATLAETGDDQDEENDE